MTDFDAAVAEFRRALRHRIDSHVTANPRAGVPLPGNASAPRRSRRPLAVAAAIAIVIVAVGTGMLWPPSLAFSRFPILESFMTGIARTAGRLVPLARQSGGAGTAAIVPEFEEASIRECDLDNVPAPPAGARGGGPNSFYMTPGRTYALCMTPAVMVRLAYRFRALPEGSLTSDTRRPQRWQLNQVSGQGANAGIAVRGGPEWARTDRYTVEAVAGYEADGDTMSGPMLRALLERRFKLKAHVETEEVPAWTLTPAAGGLKLKPMGPGGCEALPPSPTGAPTGARPRTLEEVRGGAKPTCMFWREQAGGTSAVWVAGGRSLDDLASVLSRLLNEARVVNKTGVSDQFNFILEYLVDDHRSLVAAVESQLGLRLEQGRTSREYLVIDSIERPGPN